MARVLAVAALAMLMATALPADAAQRADNPYPCSYCLFQVRTDGMGFRSLLPNPYWQVLDLSPTRQSMVFRDGSAEDQRLFVAALDGGDRRTLAPDGRNARFSPDGRKVVLAREPRAGTPREPPACWPSSVWIVGIDGEGVTKVGGDCAGGFPSWAPDSRNVAFLDNLSWTRTTGWAAIADLAGRTRAIGFAEQAWARIDWAPSGDLLAYLTAGAPERANAIGGSAGGRASDSPYELRIIRTDGRMVRRFRDAYTPAWSPDGSVLAYTHDDTPYEDVPPSYAAYYDASIQLTSPGGKTRVLTRQCEVPVWSPDGRSIACTFGNDVFVVAVANGQKRRVVRLEPVGELNDLWWSTDGQRLLLRWTFTEID